MLNVSRGSSDGGQLVPDPPIYSVSIRFLIKELERVSRALLVIFCKTRKIFKQELIASVDGTYYLRYPIYAVK